MRSIVSFLAASALLASSVSALQCPKGQGPDNTNTFCQPCPPGYYNDQSAGNCKPAQPGWFACEFMLAACYGSTKQQQCGKGYYSTGNGNSACTICPAGSICQSDTTDQPLKCVPGRYMPYQGSGDSQCLNCPVGTYNNEYGATACCKCCAGTYNDQTSQTHCYYCGEHTNPQVYYSPVGATSVGQCQANPIPGTTNAPKGTCDVTPPMTDAGKGQCPPEQGTSPTGGPKQRRSLCAPGYKSCPIYNSVGQSDCVDVKNDPEQCGGCVSVPGVPKAFAGPEGQDCTAIPNVSVVSCAKGSCVIESCRKGYTKSTDGTSCKSVSAMNIQERQQNESSKRDTRGRRWRVSHSEH